MALVQCHECGKDVSTEAKTCPACGAKVRKPPKQVSRQTLFVLGGVVLIMVFASMGANQRKAETEAAKTPEQRAQEQKEKDQNGRAAIGAVALKKAMKDPKSFSLTSALVMADGTACYDYRAMNSFGASLPSSAVMLPTGKVLAKEQDGSAFTKAWNSRCANKPGREIARTIEISGVLE